MLFSALAPSQRARYALDRLKKHSYMRARNRLKEEGEKLRERVNKFGSAPASHLFFIGRK